ncbi:uncharacterized protein Gasu_57740 [Galdieria sulphuraria]|uniref:Uncharacterized protein n=1 Tax=Galdieria sulphuraria TaxID=130081 RepID=M2WS33_GALSU|nr:uncharacterized protein Gasu_57740 [Galdieria sulphuraria]EME26655.1 hypothetical protein Gasu_57740 [Galdieria sulphuraria]|eukprot:XP_005703175.1 hypothetical protein Gasu_57740 [Galdieria sulphuraria]
MLSIQVLQVWSSKSIELENLKLATQFEMAVEEAPLYRNLLASHSRKKKGQKNKDCNKQRLMPNHFISTAIPDIYYVMKLYKTAAWRRNTLVGNVILPMDDLNSFKDNGPVWCNMIHWNRKLSSVETTGRVLLRIILNICCLEM